MRTSTTPLVCVMAQWYETARSPTDSVCNSLLPGPVAALAASLSIAYLLWSGLQCTDEGTETGRVGSSHPACLHSVQTDRQTDRERHLHSMEVSLSACLRAACQAG